MTFSYFLWCFPYCNWDKKLLTLLWGWIKLNATREVVYNCFLRKLVRLWCTDVTSFCMEFEKGDVGYCRRLSGVVVVVVVIFYLDVLVWQHMSVVVNFLVMFTNFGHIHSVILNHSSDYSSFNRRKTFYKNWKIFKKKILSSFKLLVAINKYAIIRNNCFIEKWQVFKR